MANNKSALTTSTVELEEDLDKMTNFPQAWTRLYDQRTETFSVSGINSSTTSVQNATESPTPFFEETLKVFNVYLMIPVMLVGLAGNSLIVTVMKSREFRKLPLGIYFIALAVSDSCMLVLVGVTQIGKQMWSITLTRTPKVCSWWTFLMNTAYAYSSWLIVCLAVERVLVISFPFKAKKLTSRAKATITVCGVLGILCVINSFNFYMMDYQSPVCRLLPKFGEFNSKVKGMLSLVLYGQGPLVLTCLCYVVLVTLVILQNKKKQQSTIGNTSTQAKMERLTVTALIVCLTYMILVSPANVYLMLAKQKGWLFMKQPPYYTVITQALVLFVRQLNYSSNFFIYLASNKLFREETRRLFTSHNIVGPTSSAIPGSFPKGAKTVALQKTSP